MRNRRYDLTEYSSASSPTCAHAELKPGLDASICSRCRLVWAHKWQAPAQPAAIVETQSLPIMQASPPQEKTPLRSSPRTAPQAVSQVSDYKSDYEFQYAVTLHRPWAYAIARMGKDIENRTMNLRCVNPGEWIAIHAGRGYDFSAEEWIQARFPDWPLPELTEQPTGIVAIAQFLGNVEQSKSIWFGGPIGWQLGEVLVTEPVDCPGQRGLWKPSDEIKQAVYRNLEVPF